MMNGVSRARWLALLIPAGLLAGAYVGQYGFDLYPCEMCWWQRYPHFVALVPAILAFFVDGKARRWLIMLAALAIAISGAIGVLHAGVEYHWWQGPTTCSTTAAGATLDDLLNAPLIRCDSAQWTLFGISLAGYNAIVSLGGAALIGWLLGRTEQKA
jgi:disulfide bond formation protein DsbB